MRQGRVTKIFFTPLDSRCTWKSTDGDTRPCGKNISPPEASLASSFLRLPWCSSPSASHTASPRSLPPAVPLLRPAPAPPSSGGPASFIFTRGEAARPLVRIIWKKLNCSTDPSISPLSLPQICPGPSSSPPPHAAVPLLPCPGRCLSSTPSWPASASPSLPSSASPHAVHPPPPLRLAAVAGGGREAQRRGGGGRRDSGTGGGATQSGRCDGGERRGGGTGDGGAGGADGGTGDGGAGGADEATATRESSGLRGGSERSGAAFGRRRRRLHIQGAAAAPHRTALGRKGVGGRPRAATAGPRRRACSRRRQRMCGAWPVRGRHWPLSLSDSLSLISPTAAADRGPTSPAGGAPPPVPAFPPLPRAGAPPFLLCAFFASTCSSFLCADDSRARAKDGDGTALVPPPQLRQRHGEDFLLLHHLQH